MLRRARDESGFGLIELLAAMTILNIGILAVVAALGSGAVTLRRSADTSTATAVADRVLEVYRGLRSCGLYLHGGTGNDVSGFPDGIPNSSSSFYGAYSADSAAYGGSPYYSNASPASTPRWVTENTTGTGYTPIPASSASCLPSLASLPFDPTKAVFQLSGADGRSYDVFAYITLVQPSVGSGTTPGWSKQVVVTVRAAAAVGRVLARDSSIIDPNTTQ